MWWNNTITTIDIWSSKIRTIIGYFEAEKKDDFHILWIGSASSNAIRKWNILDMEEFKSNLDISLEEAEKMAWEQVSWAYISFNSSSFEVDTNRWIVAIAGWEVTQEDIDRSLDMAKNGIELPNREILKVIPEVFSVDLEEWVKNPVGMNARKLEVVANIFSMSSNIISNIRKAVSDVWIEVYDIYPNLLSAPEGVLTKRQKELGVVCIDIGSSTTGVTVYEEWVLRFSSIIPIGWDNVTNDIALWLRTSTNVAEKLKLEYAEIGLEHKSWYVDKEINVDHLELWEDNTLSPLYLSQIVTARYEEIFHFVQQELKKAWRDGMLPEWAVCVWWWAKVQWFLESAKEHLRLPAFIGIPVSADDLSDASIKDPVFAWVIGTMILSEKYGTNNAMFSINIWGFLASIQNIFKKLLP